MNAYINNYIGAGTQALYPVFDNGYPLTKIFSVSGESIIQMPTIQIIKESIIRYGSNYDGAVKSANTI
nr:competence protein ComK [Pradoshia eiseniae]